MSVNVTNHAAMRYAERIADKESMADINAYIARNRDKIENDINLMLDHSDFIYHGKVGSKDNGIVDVYLSGTWVLLLDAAKSKVITLYKVDFNVGEDFNKQFIQKILERMDIHKQELEEIKKSAEEERTAYQQIVKDNKDQIAEYRIAIKRLEKVNTDYQEIIDNIDARYLAAEVNVRHDVEDLVMKREF